MTTNTMPKQKRVTITTKRQFTIPQKFFSELGFDREAICTLAEGMLIIQPATQTSSDGFAEEILSDLIKEGYTGNELLAEFKLRQSKIRPAIEELLKQAKEAANGRGEYSTYDDIFGLED